MLIEFRVANFLSFQEMTTLSMVATADKEYEDSNVFRINDKLRLLKSTAIYGANGAGKSNLMHALSFMRSFVLYPPKPSKKETLPDHSYKLDVKSRDEPSFFEVIFWQDKKRFRYGFEMGNNRVITEWLFYTPTVKEVALFTRNDEEGIILGAAFKEAKGLEAKPKDSRLFLTYVAEYNNESSLSQSIIEWFSWMDVLQGSAIRSNLDLTLHLLEDAHADDHYKEKLIALLQKLDVLDDFELDESGTSDVFPDDMPKEVQAYFMDDTHKHPAIMVKRNKYDGDAVVGVEKLDLMRDESEGTQKLFAFAGAILSTLELGGVLVIDELEVKLHPLITKTIIELFNSNVSNAHYAQLIFTTHDTNLLSNRFFRRDQIWFVEKSPRGSSALFSLAEYKDKPRKDATYNKDYILGKYGAVPFIGDFDELVWGKH